MEFSIFNTAIWHLIRQMDWIALLILAGLFFVSVICIAIIASKVTAFKQHRKQLVTILQRVKYSKNVSDITIMSQEFSNGLGGKFLAETTRNIKHIKENQAVLSQESVNRLEILINQTIDKAILEEEAYLPFLSTCASAAPLVGLFGTIWGLIHAFIDISQEKSADIATVAPGMAEALIVTLAGLIVAIPAMIAFYYFSNELRKFDFYLAEIGDIILTTTKQDLLK
jgi:biopolymer transport protein TolQ